MQTTTTQSQYPVKSRVLHIAGNIPGVVTGHQRIGDMSQHKVTAYFPDSSPDDTLVKVHWDDGLVGNEFTTSIQPL